MIEIPSLMGQWVDLTLWDGKYTIRKIDSKQANNYVYVKTAILRARTVKNFC